MNNTHIQRLRCAIARHGAVLEVLIMSAALCVIMLTENVPLGAHFLQGRRPSSVSVTLPSDASRAPLSIADRAAQRRLQRMITRTATVADVSRHRFTFADKPVHAAAPVLQAEPDVVTPAPVTHPSTDTPAVVSNVIDDTPAHAAAPSAFPAFGRAVHPVSRVPAWGAMTTPAEWNRTHQQLETNDFVRTPAYDPAVFTVPMDTLLSNRNNPEVIRTITMKLYYSTRFFGAYDLDAHEFSAVHPGLDLKLAEGAPVGAVAGGRVHAVRNDARTLGLHVLVEHRAPDGNTYYSIYGHLERTSVQAGDTVTAGHTIGTVGMTGHTTGPHLHLQIDRGEPDEAHHEIYWPDTLPSRAQADLHTINPIVFIRSYAGGS